MLDPLKYVNVNQPVHQQIYVPEIDADIDIGIVELVRLLNRVEGLTTLQSCEGDPHHAYVYYAMSDRQSLCDFTFSALASWTRTESDEVWLSVQKMADHDPVGKVSFDPAVTEFVTAAIIEAMPCY